MSLNIPGDELFALMALHRLAQLGLTEDSDDDEPRIRELGDDDDLSSSRSSLNQLQLMMEFESKSSSLINSGKHERAYELVKRQFKHGPEMSFVPVLVKYYVTLMYTDRGDKAATIRDRLISIIKEKLEVSPKDAQKYGDSLRQENKYFEAILFYQVSSELCSNEASPDHVLNALQSCALGTKLAITELLDEENDQQVSKRMMKQYVVSGMHKMRERISRVPIVNKKASCLVQALCLHHIENSEHLVGDLDARQSTIQEGINLMKRQLGDEAEKHHLYGGFLNNLGHNCLLKGRHGDAAKLFNQAKIAKKKAEDYDSFSEKREDVQRSELALKLARLQS